MNVGSFESLSSTIQAIFSVNKTYKFHIGSTSLCAVAQAKFNELCLLCFARSYLYCHIHILCMRTIFSLNCKKKQQMASRFPNSLHVNNLNYHDKLNDYLGKKYSAFIYTRIMPNILAWAEQFCFLKDRGFAKLITNRNILQNFCS